VWDLAYKVRPAQRFESSLLLGYGSYEGIRGGFEAVHNNFLGQAHRGRLQFIYSQKSAYGDYLYTMPQIFGMRTDAALRLFGLEREEVSFLRQEYGMNLGVRRHIGWIGTDLMLRYQLESVRADAFDSTADAPTDSDVGSITLGLTRDRTDNPVAPRRGYLLALSFETAAQAIGGEVDFQRFDGRISWHRAVGREKYVHLGLRHGAIWAMNGTPSTDIPLAERFFPGGEGTIRGYVEGEAAPRAPDGTVIGAEVSSIVNVEFEQGLTKNISAVVFVDAGLTAESLDDYPGNETRVSVGLGLRFNSAIGPARLEYGYNVVREPGDDNDAWHFALGFPF
jgi:outer membrane protein assembly factor BamA